MKFEETEIGGAFVIEHEPVRDERGFFARSWCMETLAENGLTPNISQISISYNASKGTFRGMHLQRQPHQEAKLVRCTRGGAFDILLDLRPRSRTYRQWTGIELTEDNYRMVYIPEGVAHGFQTIEDDTEILYIISEAFSPAAATGFRHDDDAFDIDLPLPVSVISAKDTSWPDFVD